MILNWFLASLVLSGNLSPEGVLGSATKPLSPSNASLPRFLANGSKPKYAQTKEGIYFSCNNIFKVYQCY
jgi:hypothetical protein